MSNIIRSLHPEGSTVENLDAVLMEKEFNTFEDKEAAMDEEAEENKQIADVMAGSKKQDNEVDQDVVQDESADADLAEMLSALKDRLLENK